MKFKLPKSFIKHANLDGARIASIMSNQGKQVVLNEVKKSESVVGSGSSSQVKSLILKGQSVNH